MRKPFMVEFTGTPEAGKTTCIRNVANDLRSIGYKVSVLRESAEILPEEIQKGTWDANLWMHYKTQAGLLEATSSQDDIILVDRGLADSNFYGKKFLWEGICTPEKYDEFRNEFNEELFPDLVVALMVPPEVAIERKGREGRLVNEKYLKSYNEMFLRYFEEIECPKRLIDTSIFNVQEMTEEVFTVIIKNLP